mmetsp:Transcript_14931/g.16889  ORF Transcript_14931/g.16889 Transcript_14931/m.16889 type:complete len:97 (-) Transcript_14931:66-356(-)
MIFQPSFQQKKVQILTLGFEFVNLGYKIAPSYHLNTPSYSKLLVFRLGFEFAWIVPCRTILHNHPVIHSAVATHNTVLFSRHDTDFGRSFVSSDGD